MMVLHQYIIADVVISNADYHHTENKLLITNTGIIRKITGIKKQWRRPAFYIMLV